MFDNLQGPILLVLVQPYPLTELNCSVSDCSHASSRHSVLFSANQDASAAARHPQKRHQGSHPNPAPRSSAVVHRVSFNLSEVVWVGARLERPVIPIVV